MGVSSFLESLVFGKKKFVPTPVYRIGISPGHGGQDSGAVAASGETEANLARQMAIHLNNAFKRYSMFAPAIYGYDEAKKNYAQRVADSDAAGDLFYVPIHLNACSDPKKNGWLVMLDPGDVERNPKLVSLAQDIVHRLQQAIKVGLSDWDGGIKDGVMVGIGRPVYELHVPSAATVYLELGYISNPTWLASVLKPEVQDMIAEAVAAPFADYFRKLETGKIG